MTSRSFSQTRYGLLADSRSIVRLEDLCVPKDGVQTGPFGSQLHNSDYSDVGIPIITVEHIAGHTISGDSIPLVRPEDAKRLDKYSLKAGDIVFSRVGSVDRSALVSEKEEGWLFSGRLLRVRPSTEKIDAGYLSYFFQLPRFKTHMRSIAVGATMMSLNTSILKEIEVVVTDLAEQRSIRKILESLDAKLANNKQLSNTLEDMAQTIFKSWFIDFDPVKAKMAGGKPAGMDDATAALFPDSMEDSELGLIPSGWVIQSLDDIADYLNGLAMQKFPVTDADRTLPVIKIAQLRAGNTWAADIASGLLDDKYIISDGDILFSWSGTLEVEIWSGGPGALNQHLFKVSGKSQPAWFAYFGTRYFLESFRQIASGKATTMGHIQRAHLSEAQLPIPPDLIVGKLAEIISPLMALSLSAKVQNKSLVNIRDSLLPRLISGELQIPEEMLVT